MQKINYKEKIHLEYPIQELNLINIDEKLFTVDENDCVKIAGNIKISGEATTINGKQNFAHPIEVNILLSKEKITPQIKAYVDDFEYNIENNIISINLIVKVEGFKEINESFPTTENQEITQIDDSMEMDTITKEQPEERIELQINENSQGEEPVQNEITHNECIDIETSKTDFPINKEKAKLKENYSLLNQVFKKKSIKKETSFFYHVVKQETTYEQIAQIYNLETDVLKEINHDEKIYPGKLILIQNIK